MPDSSRLIEQVVARQILDSRGRPTIEADVILSDGTVGRACAPSGASTGRHEAVELRDGDPLQFAGLGVAKAVTNVANEIAPALKGFAVNDQAGIDATMTDLDGTSNFSRLGGNAVLATSLAICRAGAIAAGRPLHLYINDLLGDRPLSMPIPMTNILSGGAHAGRGMDIQDFLAIPIGANNYAQALTMVNEVRATAAQLSARHGLPVLLADEGGLSPGLETAEKALDLMVESFKAAGYEPGVDIAIALDVASSELCQEGLYNLARQGETYSGVQMVDYIVKLAHNYPIVSIEDPLDQDDWIHWAQITSKLGNIQLLGDDLFATNPERITRGAVENVANAALIKVNQNGTLSGTFAAMRAAWAAGYSTIVSARSGETDDAFISDLAVGSGAGQIKIGSTRNSERLSKYNQLLRIEAAAELPFAGRETLAGIRPKVAA
ncbi:MULTISPECIES: phosphopyruvate hydratase [unclassified Sphingobium]|uniref:phosphopyruvate hydratase n=1 Tax=unclassified Sphingobium TaxID=2611147 RepID=UPI0007700762|nr:phosphopyruvate hydratase [Sphingobium sp. TKS]AMK25292.1 enolase [Sphingobium sp. TKS]NML87948.1 phosphopyruvate hydratase [Sphingobium sp. TB-6]